MTDETRLQRLAEHYDNTETAGELAEATAAGPDLPPGGEPMATFAVRLPTTVLDDVRAAAARHGVTTSALIRRWVEVNLALDTEGRDERAVPVQDLLELIGRTPPHATG